LQYCELPDRALWLMESHFLQLLYTGTKTALHRTIEFTIRREHATHKKQQSDLDSRCDGVFGRGRGRAEPKTSALPSRGRNVDDNLGAITGDLKGAVSATILSTEVIGNNLVFHVQHHWVTESGDMLSFDPATATTTSVGPGLYAVITYPVHLTGGTGKFAGVKGDFNNIGEVDLNSGQLVLRYSGQLCSAER